MSDKPVSADEPCYHGVPRRFCTGIHDEKEDELFRRGREIERLRKALEIETARADATMIQLGRALSSPVETAPVTSKVEAWFNEVCPNCKRLIGDCPTALREEIRKLQPRPHETSESRLMSAINGALASLVCESPAIRAAIEILQRAAPGAIQQEPAETPGHRHTDECWEPDSGCDMGRNEAFVGVAQREEALQQIETTDRTRYADILGKAVILTRYRERNEHEGWIVSAVRISESGEVWCEVRHPKGGLTGARIDEIEIPKDPENTAPSSEDPAAAAPMGTRDDTQVARAANEGAIPSGAACDPAITLNGYQLRNALEFCAPDATPEQLESDVTIQYGDGHSGKGHYVCSTEYPDEGSILLDDSMLDAAGTGSECICKGNWRLIIKETESLLDKRFRNQHGEEYTFFGIVHGSDDFYYGMSSKDHGMQLLSCVGSIEEGHGYHLVDPQPSPNVPWWCAACDKVFVSAGGGECHICHGQLTRILAEK